MLVHQRVTWFLQEMVRHELTQEMGKFGFNFRVNLDDLAAIAGRILAGSGGQVVQDQGPYILG